MDATEWGQGWSHLKHPTLADLLHPPANEQREGCMIAQLRKQKAGSDQYSSSNSTMMIAPLTLVAT